jgi:hypothetical protein
VPRRSHFEQALEDARDLTKPIRKGLEKFFIATEELEDKKLNIIGWKGPKLAVQAIKDPNFFCDTRRRARLELRPHQYLSTDRPGDGAHP